MLLAKHKYFFILLALISAAVPAYSQLNISPNGNATSLVNTIVGPGVTVSGASLNCNGQGAGTFQAGGSNLGISSGIILSTGMAVHASGPNSDDGSSDNSGCFAGQTPNFFDSDLSAIESQATYDGCVLEFDIKPVCSTLNINYVFASEEYPEFVCSTFNDVFGFFISGPNPAGGNYSNTNIAQIPGTGIPVQINSINGGQSGANSQGGSCVSLGYGGYYVDNSGGSSVQYDGFTVPLVAAANVTPCATYHIKLAIADAGDCYYDSGVFLAYHGLTCPQAQVPAITGASTPVNCTSDGSATVNVSNFVGPVTYNWAPGGQTTASISNLTPGTYTCTIGFTQPCPYTQKIYISVSGQNSLTATASSTNAYCGSPTGTATAFPHGGIPPYTAYSWNTTPVQTTSTATQLIPGTYTVAITDNNGCTMTTPVTVKDSLPTISISDSIVDATCNQPNGAVYITGVSGGTMPYSYSWNSVPAQSTQTLSNVIAGSYNLTLTDANNCLATGSYVVNNLANLPLNMVFLNEKCNQHNGSATVTVLNGTPAFSYSWSQDPALNAPTANNLPAGHYVVNITDAAGCTNKDSVDLLNINDPFTGNIYTSVPEPEVDHPFQLIIDNPPLWSLISVTLPDGTIRNLTSIDQLYENYGTYQAVFYVQSTNGCRDSVVFPFFVKDFMTIYIPNAFTPNGDVLNPVWFVYGTIVKEVKIYVFDRWGNKFFESDSLENGWDGTNKGQKAPEDVYVYKVIAKDYYGDNHTYTGRVSLIR